MPISPEELEARIAVLHSELYRYADRVVRLEKWVDAISSPLYKRIWFWLRGWRWRTLGRWRGPDTSRWPAPCNDWWGR